MALLHTSVRSATLCIWELNLAEMAQNVSSNGANAADCKQRRKCLKLGEILPYDWDVFVVLARMLSSDVSKSGLEIFIEKRLNREEEEYSPHHTIPGKGASA